MIISHMPVSSLVINEASVINDDEGSLTYLCLSCSSVSIIISHMPVSSLVMKGLLLTCVYHAPLYQ